MIGTFVGTFIVLYLAISSNEKSGARGLLPPGSPGDAPAQMDEQKTSKGAALLCGIVLSVPVIVWLLSGPGRRWSDLLWLELIAVAAAAFYWFRRKADQAN
jgi:hypothetical protein